MTSSQYNLQSAFQYCMNIAQNHYENFPVASFLLTKELRAPVSAIYAFARTADDFADEGIFSREQRLSLLNDFAAELDYIEQWLNSSSASHYESNNPIFIALSNVIKNYNVPISLFHDLLKAFRSDVTTTRYDNFADILAYCHCSAAPVGRILLYLNRNASDENLRYSDAICIGLQLINFYQDIQQDIIENDRLYIPLDELESFGVSVQDIKNAINNHQTQMLMTQQIGRARKLYQSGQPLCFSLSGRFALEIRTIYAGGQLILDKLEQNISSIYQRPRLSRLDKILILWRGLFPIR